MNLKLNLIFLLAICLSLPSCVSKKQLATLKADYDNQLAQSNKDLGKCGEDLNDYMNRLSACEQERDQLKGDVRNESNTLKLREEQIRDLKEQLADVRNLRDRQIKQVEDLTDLSQSASENINQSLAQLAKKDRYIHLLQAAKTKADSINLALAVNLKGVLRDGIEDNDVEVRVDKTVVFINLSDKMLYQSGSANITSRANEVLGKIAKIIESRPNLEVMVEGYTDNQPISQTCFKDNWDLSVKRATSVVRVLQGTYKIDPNRLIAAGRGEYNTLASNDTVEGRSLNRRTRIIILPKIAEFYDLLNPDKVPD